MSDAVDVVVVGAGPAGLAAATWLARYRRTVVVLDSEEYRNRWVERSHGYLGLDNIPPSELRKNALSDLEAYDGVEVRTERADSARQQDNARGGFVVSAGGTELAARRLILATGVADAFPEVEGFFEHYGASVFHCPSCDGYEARDAKVAVFGWSSEVVGFSISLLEWAAQVTVVTDDHPFEGDQAERQALLGRGVQVIEDGATHLLGQRGQLRGIRTRSGATLDCELAFFTIAHHPVSGLAEQLGCGLTSEGCVAVDENGETSVPGVYAAGDLTPGMQVVQVAAAKGAVAGISCAQSLGRSPDCT